MEAITTVIELLRPYLLPALIVGGLLMLISRFVGRPSWSTGLLWLGLVIFFLAVVGFMIAVFSPPGHGPTIPEQDWELPEILPVDDVESVLTATWNAAAQADWPIAELLAEISEAAYLSPVEAQAKFQSLGFTDIGGMESGSMVGYVLSLGGTSVIVFRGTDDASDWITNLETTTQRTPHGRVHRGFSKAYRSLSSQLQELLQRQSPDQKLWVTGHSLGGALAVLCAYDLVEKQGRPVSGLITFGQPMVARRDFAAHLDEILQGRYAYLVNEADVIPRIPPNYRHCGSLVWYTQGMIRRAVPQPPRSAAALDDREAASAERSSINEIEPLSEREFRELQANLRAERVQDDDAPEGTPQVAGSLPLISDHAMVLYLEKIQSFLLRETSK